MDPADPERPPAPPAEPAQAPVELPRPPVDPSSPLRPGGAFLAFMAGFFGGQVVGTVVLGVVIGIEVVAGSIHLPGPTDDPLAWTLSLVSQPAILLSSAVASSGTFVLTAWAALRLAKRRVRTGFGLVRAPLLASVAAVIGVAAVGMFVDEIVSALQSVLPDLGFSVLGAIGEAARAGGPAQRVLTFVCMTIVPGFSEEVLFRGLLQRSLVARWGAIRGIVVASLVFGLVHIDPAQGTGAVLTGLFLGWVAWRSRSIVPAIAAHTANNALAWLGANLPFLREMSDRHEHMPPWALAIAGVAAVVSIAGLWLVTRRPVATTPVS